MSKFNKLEVFEGWFCNMGDWNMYVGQRKELYKYSIFVCPLDPSIDIPWASSKLVLFERIEIISGDAIMLPYDIQQLHLKHCYGARSLNDIRLGDANDLKGCTVEDCFDLVSIFSSKCDQLKELESLTLRNLANLEVLVGIGVRESSLSTFSSLKEITLCRSPKIKKLFAADWVLHNLEKIEVSGCLELEEIITEPDGEGMGTNNDSIEFKFPKLTSLILANLPKLKGICSENAVMVCNSLQVIEISNCPKVKRIPLLLPQLKVDGEGKLYPSNTLQEIRMQTEDWWESVEWKHPSLNVKNVVQPLINPYGLVWSAAVGPSSTIYYTHYSGEQPDGCVIIENAVMVCNSLQVIEISNCPKVKRIPLYLPQLEVDDEGKLSPSNTLQEIRVRTTDWWESVEWEHPILNVKNVVQPLLKFCNRNDLEWRPAVGSSSVTVTHSSGYALEWANVASWPTMQQLTHMANWQSVS
ncbi:hypothetical protein Gotri_026430 [Gossypium trilobum]|uniref:Disease resistance protein At4g27190-like leucine-rich repeats domain-containing protein n=1 Tax=Gossypium trilobum TaxID=34281 RepID=A0A7J9FSU1_9ROSI|nr:hypothetical protein [Gossypium trilobum]